MDSASKIPTESYRDILGWQHIKPEIEWDYIRMVFLVISFMVLLLNILAGMVKT